MRLLFFFLAALCAPLATAGVDIQHWTAPNGARVYFVEIRSLPILDIQVDFAAGSAYDPKDKSGLSRLTRGLLDAGAGTLDEEAIAERLTDTGAGIGGVAELDRAGLSLRTLSSAKERDASLELLRVMLQQPTFPEPVLERERARMIAGIKEQETQPGSIVAKRLSAGIYPDHPYGFNPTVESVSGITRQDLVDFHRRFYVSSRAVVSIVGDVSRPEAERIALHLTDGLPASGSDAGIAEPSAPAGNMLRVPHPASQSHIEMGLPAMKRGDPDLYPLVVGNYVLGGGGFVSRLTKEVREKRGYAYSVYSYFVPLQVAGPFEIGLQTRNDQADEALKVVRATLDEFIRKGPTGEELANAKRNIIDGFVLRLDSNRKILDHVAVIGFYRLPLTYLDDYPKNVEKVTAEQIRDAFRRRVDPERLVTVIVGGGAQ